VRRSNKKLCSWMLGITSVSLSFLVPAAGTTSAAEITIPIPPIVILQPPPCISTGALTEFPAGCYTCQVRNATGDNYSSSGITIEFRNEQNEVDYTTGSLPLGPGITAGAEFCSPGGADSFACVVTTGVGTTAALQDLVVVEQFAPGIAETGKTSTNSSTAETGGKIFASCAPAGPSVPAP
jgi:hypothetical protein